jgi:hypothetical protein
MQQTDGQNHFNDKFTGRAIAVSHAQTHSSLSFSFSENRTSFMFNSGCCNKN